MQRIEDIAPTFLSIRTRTTMSPVAARRQTQRTMREPRSVHNNTRRKKSNKCCLETGLRFLLFCGLVCPVLMQNEVGYCSLGIRIECDLLFLPRRYFNRLRKEFRNRIAQLDFPAPYHISKQQTGNDFRTGANFKNRFSVRLGGIRRAIERSIANNSSTATINDANSNSDGLFADIDTLFENTHDVSHHPSSRRALGLQPGILPLNRRDLLFLRVALEN